MPKSTSYPHPSFILCSLCQENRLYFLALGQIPSKDSYLSLFVALSPPVSWGRGKEKRWVQKRGKEE